MALNEAVHGGKVNWKGFALDVGSQAISNGVDHVINTQGLAGDVEQSMANSAANTLASDAVHRNLHDWQNVAEGVGINAVGNGLGTYMGESSNIGRAIGENLTHAFHEDRINAPVNNQAKSKAINQALARRQAVLDHNGQVLGHELDALGSVPDTTTPQTNPYGNPLGDGVFGSAPKTRAANQSYGSAVHPPTADVAQPNVAEQARHHTTAHIIAQQSAEHAQRAQRQSWLERGWHDAEHGLSDMYDAAKTRIERDVVLADAALRTEFQHSSSMSKYDSAFFQGTKRALRMAPLLDGGDDPDLFPEYATAANPLADAPSTSLWKTNNGAWLMFRGKVGDSNKEVANDSSSYSAHSASEGSRLRAKLAFQEAGILDEDGHLTNEAVKNAGSAMGRSLTLTNQSVVGELTKDGGEVADWGKFTTKSIEMPNGQRAQIHFYQNKVTGQVNYTHPDFKIKGVVNDFYPNDTPQDVLNQIFRPKF